MAERIPDEASGGPGGGAQSAGGSAAWGRKLIVSGVTGASVECADGLSVEELTTAIPHGQVGVTTVGRNPVRVVMWCEPQAAVRIMQP